MKKYRIKDEDGSVLEVEELDSEEIEEVQEIKDEPEQAQLTSDEILALKELAKSAPELMKLLSKPVECAEEDSCEKRVVDEDEKEDEIEEEEVIETKTRDSKTSFGSVAKPKIVEDSIEDNEEIESAWAKRYGGEN